MVPRFLNTGFKYVEVLNVTDVQQIIDAAYALVTSPTDPASGWTAFTVNGAGYYVNSTTSLQVPQFKFKLTRVTQYRMTLSCRGGNDVTLAGNSPNNSIQIPANPCLARIFVGDGHFCVDVICFTAVGEFCWCGSLDTTPDDPNFIGLNTAWVMGSRRDSDFARQYSDWSHVTVQQGDDVPIMSEYAYPLRVVGGGNGAMRNVSGSLIYRPREIGSKVRGDTGVYGTVRWMGRTFQTLLVPGSGFTTQGAKLYCPIDTGVLGQFCILVGSENNYGRSAAIRIG